MSVPYIHTFYTPKGYYFYDFNTNAIVRINKSVYDFLNEWEKNKDCPNSQSECGNIIDELKRAGFLSERHWTKIEHPATKMLDRYLHSSVESITLQVTQQCNLKCNYCPYSGSYYNREHSNRHMSFETAKQAIDFYIAHSFDIPVAHIGFYGGEPLIEYDLIRKIVEYCREKCFGKKIMYFMTTNATLLTEEVIDFLMENEFNLSISLDGPRNYHDRNRHRIDDSGSFDIVMQNIERLYKRYPEKKDNVQFNCVLDPTSDIIETGIIVKHEQEIEFNQIEKLFLMPSIISLDDKCFRTIIDKAKSLNIEIIDMRNNGNDVCLKRDDKLYGTEIKKIDKPVVLVIGTGDRTNKFDIQLIVRECFQKKGYTVSQIGTKGYCEYLGFHSFPNFMYSNLQVTDRILGFNHYIYELSKSENADVIIIGVPGGLMPYSEKYNNDFGYLNFMVSNAVVPDYVVLATTYVDYNRDYINAIVDSLRYKYEYDVDAVFIGNSSINWDVTESLDTLTYVTLDKNFIDEEVRKCNAYSVYDSDSIKQFSEQLINTLVGYDNYPTL